MNHFSGSVKTDILILESFIEKARIESCGSLFSPDLLSQADVIATGYRNLLDYLETCAKLYDCLISQGLDELRAKAYFYAGGLDMALRPSPTPFLLRAKTLAAEIECEPARAARLAAELKHLFDPPALEAFDGFFSYFKQTTLAAQLPNALIKKFMLQLLGRRMERTRDNAHTYDSALRAAGHGERTIPGLMLALGHVSGCVTQEKLRRMFTRPIAIKA